MVLVPTYGSQKDIYDPKKQGIVSLVAGIASFFPFSLRPLLAILAVVAGIIGVVFGARQKRWGWLVAAVFGFFFGALVLILMASGQDF